MDFRVTIEEVPSSREEPENRSDSSFERFTLGLHAAPVGCSVSTDPRGRAESVLTEHPTCPTVAGAEFHRVGLLLRHRMKRAIQRHDAGEARVITVIVKSVDWSIAPFGMLRALPREGKAVTLWADRDSAWKNVFEGIKRRGGGDAQEGGNDGPSMREPSRQDLPSIFPSGEERRFSPQRTQRAQETKTEEKGERIEIGRPPRMDRRGGRHEDVACSRMSDGGSISSLVFSAFFSAFSASSAVRNEWIAGLSTRRTRSPRRRWA